MKRRFMMGVLLTVLSFAIVLVGCNSDNGNGGNANGNNNNSSTGANNNNNNNNNSADPISGTVTVAGSTSVHGLAEELGMAYMSKNSDARVEVAGGGSGAGVRSAQSGTSDIGMASRGLNDDETGVEAIVIAIDGIAAVVHPNNEVEDLTIEQIRDIFSGDITNWSEIGGPDSGIVVVSREEGSGTRDAFTDIVLGDATLTSDAIIQNTTGAVREAVSQDPLAIGYISTGGMTSEVKALLVSGVEATEENILNDTYPIARPFNFLISDSQSPSAVTQDFIDFILSAEGQEVVVDQGFVPVN